MHCMSQHGCTAPHGSQATTLRERRTVLVIVVAFPAKSARAHGSMAGDIVIDHPYATPTPSGERTGSLYFRTLKNTGRQSDRLLGAHSAVAASVQIQRSEVEGGRRCMRHIDALDLPAGVELKLRHDGDIQLALLDLKAPLKEGERFAVVLRFERAGEKEVTAWVQQPR